MGTRVCFTSTPHAAYYLAAGRNGWLYDGDRITCDGCAITAECDLRGHRFPSTNTLRRCDRCGAPDEQENPK
ncbi:hypothetical protein [Nocardia spumae]|uniref:hypothetical protein n=1 Tax=Nocardia spumae TaxID=2887190 RepID=UPI001D13D404|nr:hypothetical protein [Nocardia spumae]